MESSWDSAISLFSIASYQTGGTYGINGIRFEVVRESSKEQLIEDASLLDVEIVLHLAVTPVRKVLWVVVNLASVSHGDYVLIADCLQNSPCKIGHCGPTLQHPKGWLARL